MSQCYSLSSPPPLPHREVRREQPFLKARARAAEVAGGGNPRDTALGADQRAAQASR